MTKLHQDWWLADLWSDYRHSFHTTLAWPKQAVVAVTSADSCWRYRKRVRGEVRWEGGKKALPERNLSWWHSHCWRCQWWQCWSPVWYPNTDLVANLWNYVYSYNGDLFTMVRMCVQVTCHQLLWHLISKDNNALTSARALPSSVRLCTERLSGWKIRLSRVFCYKTQYHLLPIFLVSGVASFILISSGKAVGLLSTFF